MYVRNVCIINVVRASACARCVLCSPSFFLFYKEITTAELSGVLAVLSGVKH